MGLKRQTVALLKGAVHLVREGLADAVLILAQTALDWPAVLAVTGDVSPLAAVRSLIMARRIRESIHGLRVLDIAPDPMPAREQINNALLAALRDGHLKRGSHVAVVYNGIVATEDRDDDDLDSVSLIHINEHLERLTVSDLAELRTGVPAETLRLVVNVAAQIGREGREGKPVGTLFVVGDVRRVLTMTRQLNLNPFRGYPRDERDLHNTRVREAVKEFAQLDGGFVIDPKGIVHAGCVYFDAGAEGIRLDTGLGTRHVSAAAITRATKAVAVCVSQSSGSVRLFADGEVAMQIEPLARPHVWMPPHVGHTEPSLRNGD